MDRFQEFKKKAQENYKKRIKAKKSKQLGQKSEDDVVLNELKRAREAVRMRDLIKRGREKDIVEIFKII